MARLGRADWLQGALDLLAEEGLAAVSVEPLARRLGVTKGSFYWHFKDRAALIEALLKEWDERETRAVITALEAFRDPRERLERLFHRALRDQPSARHYLALDASSDPTVREAMRRVAARRVEYMASCFRGMGVEDAGTRAHIAYAAYVGTLHLTRDLNFPEDYAEHLIARTIR